MKKHEHKIRVRYAETDAMGVVHHSVHYIWFEVGRMEFCRANGLDYRDMEKERIGMVVVEANCAYKAPAKFDDELTIHTSLESMSGKTAVFNYEITRDSDGKLIATGKTVHVSVTFDGKVVPIPDKFILDK